MTASVVWLTSELPGMYLLMMCAVSVALVMLEWIRTSYFKPNAANL